MKAHACNIAEGTTRRYAGALVFVKEKDADYYLLEAASTGDGRIVFTNENRISELYPEYHHKDHLGNVRTTFTDRNEDKLVEIIGFGNEVTQVMDFYPFGLQQQGEGVFGPSGETSNRYRYNGKEFSDELGLYDYGARWYDPAVGRWGQIDPLAEAIPNHSAYAYTFSNPISFNDPTGMMGENPYGLNSSTNSTQQDKDESQAEVENAQSNKPLEVLFYNDPNANTKLTSRNLASFLNGTSDILSLNGISDNVNYKFLDDLDGVRKFATHKDRTLFLALTNRAFCNRAEGQSQITASGTGISFYSTSSSTGKTYFNSGLDVEKFRKGQGSHLTNPSFRGWWKSEIDHLAYAGAHELFHQLDVHARNAVPGNMSSYPYDGHYNSTINILNKGGAYGHKGGKGVGSSYKMLPEGVRRRILEYLNYR